MTADNPNRDPLAGSSGGQFDTTHWSVVLAAGHRSSPDSDMALESLCRTYWYPLYAYARRRVPNAHEAQDLTQEFFSRLLEKNYVAEADPGRGRFRAFLLTAFKHFLSKEWDKTKAQKRGGGQSVVSLDFDFGETRYALEPADEETPERLFDRQWAITAMDQVLSQLRSEFVQGGREEQFERLKVFLSGRPAAGSYEKAAVSLGMSVGAVQVAAHRLRRRYRELLEQEIAQTVASPDDIQDEVHSLFAALGSS